MKKHKRGGHGPFGSDTMPTAHRIRFWSQVEQRGPDDCWEWIGPKIYRIRHGDNLVEGKLLTEITGNGVGKSVQRIAYQAAGNYLHSQYSLSNICRFNDCCNPAHIYQDPFKGSPLHGWPVYSGKAATAKLRALEFLSTCPRLKRKEDILTVARWDFYLAREMQKAYYRINGYRFPFAIRPPLLCGGMKYELQKRYKKEN